MNTKKIIKCGKRKKCKVVVMQAKKLKKEMTGLLLETSGQTLTIYLSTPEVANQQRRL